MLKTGELSKLFDIDRTTLNHYVRQGLLAPSAEERNKYHSYSFNDSVALAYIRYYRGMGFATEEITDLLKEADHDKKSASIKAKQEEIGKQIVLLRLKQLLLENTQRFLDLIRFAGDKPQIIPMAAYYFLPKQDIEGTHPWSYLYRMVPSLEFSACCHLNDTAADPTVLPSASLDFNDLDEVSGLSLREDWFSEYTLEPPVNAIYHPSEDKCVISFRVSDSSLNNDLAEHIAHMNDTVLDSQDVPHKIRRFDPFIFYIIPTHYGSEDSFYDCVCFFDID